MNTPNFFGVGQTRGGTTFLYSLLKAHPNVFLSDMKEARFFNHHLDDPKRSEKIRGNRPVTMEDYLAIFEPATSEHKAIGDISPQYLESPCAHQQIKEFRPDAKIICTLRHPADRMYSLYTMGEGPAEMPFIENFRANENEWLVESAYSYRNLRKYFDTFDKENILLIEFKALTQNTLQEKRRVAKFLGVDPNKFPEKSESHENASGVSRYKSLDIAFRRLRKLAWLRDAIPADFEKGLRSAWRSTLKSPAKLSAADRFEVMTFFREDTLKLQELVDIDLSSWLPENSTAPENNEKLQQTESLPA